MNKKLLLAGFWTVSVAFICQGAESKEAINELKMQLSTINASVASPMSKLTKLMVLEERISNTTASSIKEQRVLQSLQKRAEKSQKQLLPTTKKKAKKQLLF